MHFKLSAFLFAGAAGTVMASAVVFTFDNKPQDQIPAHSNSMIGGMERAVIGEYLNLIIIADKHEVAVSSLAMRRDLSTDAYDFNEMMHRDHSKNLQQAMALSKKLGIAPKTTYKTVEFKKITDGGLSSLESKSRDSFEQAYIDAMVKGHKHVLGMLEEMNDKSQEGPQALRNFLAATKEAVSMHYEHAKMLQSGK